MDVHDIRSSINTVLTKRKNLLPRIEQEEERLKDRYGTVLRAKKKLSTLLSLEKELSRKDKLTDIDLLLDSLNKAMEEDLKRIASLRSRFSRETVCIGVSGMARVGKSTTLQKMSGLTDKQIPTGSRQNVTAVHSIIHNTSKGPARASISFLTENEFINNYIGPLVTNINEVLVGAERLECPQSVEDLRRMSIPTTLGNEITSTATDSLKRLHDAKDCVDSYKDYLSSPSITITLEDKNLEEFRQFVAYPEDDGIDANRAYLAVKGAEIFCRFPSISDVKLSLVDLPGFGEINEGVAEGHIAALDKNVDHILDILKPQDTSGSITQADGHALDLLYKVQQGISSRKDLITVGINIFDAYAQNAEKLREDFAKRYNLAQDNPLNIEMYHANKQDSVFAIFGHILSELAINLPHMDQELLDEAVEQSASAGFQDDLISARDILSSLASTIPLPERILNDEIQSISNAIIFACQQYENELASVAHTESDSKVKFNQQVDACRALVDKELQDGFFLGMQRWKDRATGQGDYYSFYREECRRIRREMIARYEGLDGFYQKNTDRFKQRAIDAVLSNTGDLCSTIGVDTSDDVNTTIDSLYALLMPIVRDTGILPALKLLKSVRFSFRHNVFLNIAPHLEELLNPYERSKDARNANLKVIELGGIGNPDDQVNKLQRYLLDIGNRANSDTGNALKKAEDRFMEYLSVCMSFFIDYLYRMDEDTFRQVFVRKLLTEYPEAIIGKRANSHQNGKKIEAYYEMTKLIQQLISNSTYSRTTPHRAAMKRTAELTRHLVDQQAHGTKHSIASNTITGTITGMNPRMGLFVSINGQDREGLIHISKLRSFLNEGYISDLTDFFEIGEQLVVRINEITSDGKINLDIVRRSA